MPTYVLHQGELIDKRDLPAPQNPAASSLPSPAIHGFDSYPSPIDGHTVASRRDRERDLTNSGSYDPRDTPAAFRKAQDARRKQAERFTAEPS